MKCNFCGKEIPDDSKFCEFCGTNIKKIDNAINFEERRKEAEEAYQKFISSNKMNEVNEKIHKNISNLKALIKKQRKSILMILCTVCVILASILVFTNLNKNTETDIVDKYVNYFYTGQFEKSLNLTPKDYMENFIEFTNSDVTVQEIKDGLAKSSDELLEVIHSKFYNYSYSYKIIDVYELDDSEIKYISNATGYNYEMVKEYSVEVSIFDSNELMITNDLTILVGSINNKWYFLHGFSIH